MDLTVLLEQKKSSVLEVQVERCVEYLEGDGVKSGQTVKKIVEWCCQAIRYDVGDVRKWGIFVKSCRLLGRFDNGGLVSSKYGGMAFDGLLDFIGKHVAGEKDEGLARESLECLVKILQYRPNVSSFVKLVCLVSDRFIVDLLLVSLELFLESVSSGSPKKLFELCVEKLLGTLARSRLRALDGSHVCGVLLPLRIPGVEYGEVCKEHASSPIVGVIDRFLKKLLFQEEVLGQYESACNVKGKKKLVSYVRLLFDKIELLVREDPVPICSLAYMLLFHYMKKSCTVVNNKRKREVVEAGPLLKFCMQLFHSMGVNKSHPAVMYGLAKMIRCLIDNEGYDVSSKADMDVLEGWFSENVRLWQDFPVEKELSSSIVCIISLFLELDHRVVHPYLGDIFRLVQRFSSIEEYDDRLLCLPVGSELCLRVVETYSRLRQLSTVLPFYFVSVDEFPALGRKTWTSTVCVGFGSMFARVPAGQHQALWELLEHSFLKRSGEPGLLGVGLVFQTFVRYVHVTENSMGLLSKLAKSTLDKVQDTKEPVYIVVYEPCVALLNLCEMWRFAEVANEDNQLGKSSVLERVSTVSPQSVFDWNGMVKDPALADMVCGLAFHALRHRVGKKDVSKIMLIVTSYIETSFGTIVEHIALICKYAKTCPAAAGCIKLVLEKLLREVAVCRPGSPVGLVDLSFYELQPVREIFTEMVLKVLDELSSTDADYLLSLLSVVPVGYFSQDDYRVLIAAAANKTQLVVCALKSHPTIVLEKQVYDFCIARLDNKSVVCAFGRALVIACPEKFKEISGNNRWLLSSAIEYYRASRKAIPETLLDLGNSLYQDQQQMAFVVQLGNLAGKRFDVNLSYENDLRDQISKDRLLLSAVCQSLNTLALDTAQFKELTDVVMEQRLKKENVDEATVLMFLNASFGEQFPLLMNTVLEDILSFRNGLNTGKRALCGVSTLALVLPRVLSPGTPGHVERERVIVKQCGESLVSALLLLATNSAMSSQGKNTCLQVIQQLLMYCSTLWKTSKLRLTRVVLEGVCKIVSLQATEKMVETCVELSFSIIKSNGRTLAQKCAAAIVSLVRVLLKWVVNKSKVYPQMFTRINEELAQYKAVFRHHAVYFLAEYLLICKNSTLTQEYRAPLKLCAFYWLDMCSHHELQQLHAVLDATCKALFKTLNDEYKQSHRFTGQV